MAKPLTPIEPITDESLPEFCAFLTANLSSDRKPEEWQAALQTPWQCRRPNYGYLLRDSGGEIVGGLGAIYSRQTIAGKQYDFCNLTSWCVAEAFRSQSMRLAMSLTSQSGFEITNFSPTKTVAGVLKFLNFKELDEHVCFFPNFPAIPGLSGRTAVLLNRSDIEKSLAGHLGEIYHDHAGYPWLKFALLEAEQKQCLLIFKHTYVRSVRGAKILYASDRALYARHLRSVSASLLLKLGLPFTQIESRFLERKPVFRRDVGGYTRKLFLSQTLCAHDIDYVYSESMCLDL